MSIPVVANLSMATRLLRIAKTMGFNGEGAVSIPVMSHSDLGVVNIIVSDTDLPSAPAGTILLNAQSRVFKQAKHTGEGAFEWSEIGSGDNLSSVLDSTPSSSTGVVPLPKPPVPEDPATSFITEPTISINAQPSQTICKPDGTLIHGSGNLSGNMVIASNSEIYLAGACRFYRTSEAFASENGTYKINVADSKDQKKDWTWVYSVSLLDTRNAKNVCDLYDVSMIVTNTKTGKSLRFAAQADRYGATFDMYDSFNSLRITDNTTNEDRSLCQNIQRIAFYNGKLGITEEDIGANGAPVGDYNFRLEATRKVGSFPPVVCEWGASVEDVDTSMLVDPVVTVNAVLNAVSVKPNGTLIHGSGNSAQQMIVANNGEIEIAGATRFYRAGEVIVPDGTYQYSANVQSSKDKTVKDWTWVYSLALINTKNSKCITDLYDVTMTVIGEELDTLSFHGEYRDGVFHFVNEEHGLDISDNTTDSFGGLVQNIQRVTFYKELLKARIGVSSGAPIGSFDFEIRAERKVGNFPPVVVAWTAYIDDHDLSMLVSPVQKFDAALNAVQLKANGTLLHGSGNKSNAMASATNGEIELAGACRFYRNSPADYPVDTSGTFPTWRMNLQDSKDATLKDWTWVYCAALVDLRNGNDLADLYDLTMDVHGENGQLVFTGSFDGQKFHMVDSTNGLDISDNTTNVSGQLCQNIQRVTFYKSQMNPELGSISGSPVGAYTFTLKAVRKIGGTVPPVICSWNAIIVDEAPPAPEPDPVVE